MSSTLPKVILHEHIEGSVTPETALVLAQKHNVSLPDDFLYAEGQYDKSAFPNGRYQYDETDFGAFVTAYDVVADLVRDADDYYLIMKDYLSRNAQQGMIYCEMITSAFHLCYQEDQQGNVSLDAEKYDQFMAAIERAITEVKEEFGTETRLQACGVRHLSLEHFNLSVDFIAKYPRKSVAGFNIAGNEMAGEFADFIYAHELVDNIPLPKSYHAGEIRGPESIRDALTFGAKRIGHGIAAIKDDELIDTLIRDQITLEVAPTSNRILVTEFEQKLDNHPLRRLYEKGVRLSINTDDAGLFGTDVEKEYHIAETVFGFNRVELLDVTLCALEAAFVEDELKQNLIAQVYQTFSEQDWRDLEIHCANLEEGALKKRLSSRLVHRD
ncbi:adenosine deaminase [Vibrio rumoiensis]|uniref:Adenosine deaminase n=1 Tax=Vibrio rumoiensis 1S-45 TaxID=1188252 RepID=A0A1E5DZU0_9VIBR|nr:adenosine deaminase [Vibrio rumoiensis]OEF23601.1 adenosine deaminase [Vibrio rumoiensis 1S-45]